MDLAARRHAELAIDYDPLAGLDSLADDDEIAVPLALRDGALLGGRVFLDDVDERTLSGSLRSRRGHEHGILQRVEDEADLDEASRPEAVIAIGDRGAELHRAGAVL